MEKAFEKKNSRRSKSFNRRKREDLDNSNEGEFPHHFYSKSSSFTPFKALPGGGGGGDGSVGLVRSKPSREIYRPPSMRREDRCSTSSAQQQFSAFENNHLNASNGSRKCFEPTKNSSFNINAKEFQPNQLLICGDSAASSVVAQRKERNGLQQSKSSGHLPGRPRVHFQDEKIKNYEDKDAKNKGARREIRNSSSPPPADKNSPPFTPPLLNGGGESPNGKTSNHANERMRDDTTKGGGGSEKRGPRAKGQKTSESLQINCNRKVILSPELQRSKTASSCLNNIPITPPNSSFTQSINTTGLESLLLMQSIQLTPPPPTQPVLKRSKSFGASPQAQKDHQSALAFDFQISRWPPSLQILITQVVKLRGVDKFSARMKIEMVTRIFEFMLGSVDEEMEGEGDEKLKDLTFPAVNIFLYFVMREKDRTVLETLLNHCTAFHQKHLNLKGQFSAQKESTVGLNLFLKFLSILYSQIKIIRLQRKQGKQLEEMNLAVLSLLCDASLSTIRTHLSYFDGKMDECLFNIFITHGRDLERAFPGKMKAILAAIRDALLGIGPWKTNPSQTLPASVQKTLMKLIELHAANWSGLPSSAVKYYYSNNHHI